MTASAAVEIAPGQTFEKDPSDVVNLKITWDDNFAPGVSLVDVGMFTVEAYDPDDVVSDMLVVDELLRVDSNRAVQFRLSGGSPNVIYEVSHKVTTDEPQTKERSFFVYAKER